MSALKKLVGQTAVYGVSSILARVLNFFLTPLYTSSLGFDPEEYGVITDWYSLVGFILVFLTFGMETTFFRFINQGNEDRKKLFNSLLSFLLVVNSLFLVLSLSFSSNISGAMGYQDHPEYLILFVFILIFDALAALPLAKLRNENKAQKFAVINISSIGVNIILNLFFILILRRVFYPELGVVIVFVANLLASIIKVTMLLREFKGFQFSLNWEYFKDKFKYAYPIIFIGLAGIVNEMLDKQLLKYILGEEIGMDNALTEVGIYGANYKLAMLIALFIQAFRYAAEPFFFAQAETGNKDKIYARVLTFFVIATAGMFLFINLYLDWIKYIVVSSEIYWEGLKIVWIILLANVFFGIYTNLSIWYKLSDRTFMGALVSCAGVVVTLSLNFILIPHIGYLGSAWATLACYFLMTILSYFLGQKYYPIKYNMKKVTFYIVISLILFGIFTLTKSSYTWLNLSIASILMFIYIWLALKLEKISLKDLGLAQMVKSKLSRK